MSHTTMIETEEYTEEELLEYKKELQKYYLACLWMEGSKIILFLIIFGAMNLLKEFFMALLVLMLMRNHGGGIHCKHYISCFLVSFGVLLASILIPGYVQLPIWLTVLLLVLCAFAGYRLVPIVSDHRPEPSTEVILRSKRVTLVLILLYCPVICVCPENLYLNIGVWTIFIHILQLLLAKFRKGGVVG